MELLTAGHEVTVIDNLINSKEMALQRVESLTGRQLTFHRADLLNRESLNAAFTQPIDAVIHLAALKSVPESIARPLDYYRVNVVGTINLLDAMHQSSCQTLVYSSSCTVYEEAGQQPIREDHPAKSATSPYGWTKVMTEQIIHDAIAGEPMSRIAILRYFNPLGARPSGLLGEDPIYAAQNLMPLLVQVAQGRRRNLTIFGNDYPTLDGTPVRDYIHVVDLAQAHIAALNKLQGSPGIRAFNLGTGTGSTVLEVIAAFEAATDQQIPYEFTERRVGDAAVAYADPSRAENELDWKATRSLEDMCRDSWRWQQKHCQMEEDYLRES